MQDIQLKQKMQNQNIQLPQFKNIEFLRFIFVAVLVYFHLLQLLISMQMTSYLPLYALSRNAYILVEFFFILSGFFLYFDIQKYTKIGFFATKRFLRLWFVPAFVVLLSIISAPFMKYIIINYINSLLSILFLNNIGLTNSVSNYVHTWYICVLFWVFLFYFCLFKLFDHKKVMFFTVIMVYLSYVAIFQASKGSFSSHETVIYGLLTMGMLRGIAGLGLGLIMGMIYERYMFISLNNVKKKKKTGVFYCIIFSIAEITILFVLFNLLVFKILRFSNDFIFVLLFAILIGLFLVKKGIISRFFENKVSNFLGKFSYSIFVMQGYLLILFSYIFSNKLMTEQRALTLFLGVLFAISGGILVYYLIEKPSFNWCKNKFLNGVQK